MDEGEQRPEDLPDYEDLPPEVREGADKKLREALVRGRLARWRETYRKRREVVEEEK